MWWGIGLSLPSSHQPSKTGAFYLVGYEEFWEFGRFVSEALSLRSQVRIGYFRRKVQLFLDQQSLAVGHQVRPRQQLQQVLPEGWWGHGSQQSEELHVSGSRWGWNQPLLRQLHGCLYDLTSSIPPPLPRKFPFRDRKEDPLPCILACCQLGWSKFRLNATLVSGVQSRQHKLEFLTAICKLSCSSVINFLTLLLPMHPHACHFIPSVWSVCF